MKYGSIAPSKKGVKMKKLSILLVCVLTLYAVMLTGCGKKQTNTIRISEVTHSLFYAPLYVAINNGYFKDEGLEIELTNAGGSNTVMTSLISNSADIGLMGPESVVYVINNGMTDVPTIFAQLTACDGSFLVGRTDESDTFDWDNLINKHIIAGRKGGMPAMTLKYILDQHGLLTGDELGEDCNVIVDTTIAFDQTTSAFLAGTGDYVTIFDPTASSLDMTETAYIEAALGEEVSDIPYTCFVATANYMNNNSENIEKFMRALKKGYDYLMKATDQQIIDCLKPSFSTPDDSLIVASVRNYIRIGAYASSFVLKESSWNRMLEIIDNAGELKARVNHADAVNTTFASNVE